MRLLIILGLITLFLMGCKSSAGGHCDAYGSIDNKKEKTII